ncbi:protein of unknown function [Anaerovirgula multivorans]|uniref:DUF4355 domain-containing protein n=1 Tax=Anaerovirgula multivorans TaxID=312168 RepID=A0A239AJ67_9FIRM|nr:DUF4355 domain-containing protein [Anaerovirgula multivorans]SNR95590.1 protein of unknown function [Anaerovirgula multivorans]
MSLERLREIVEQNKENKEIQDYIKGLNPITPDGVSAYLESEGGKKLLQPKLDSTVTKAIETWKANNLSKHVEEEIGKRFPGETEEQKKIRELTQQFETLKQEKTRESLTNIAIKEMTAKGLPIELADYLIANDEDTTKANLTKLEQVWQTAIAAAVESKFKDNGRDPHKSKEGYQGVNPWKKETYNLTMQAKLLKEDPTLAQSLKAQSK